MDKYSKHDKGWVLILGLINKYDELLDELLDENFNTKSDEDKTRLRREVDRVSETLGIRLRERVQTKTLTGQQRTISGMD